ncbi:pyruvate carboxylase subunit B [Enterococcus songbeiensis]
MKRININETVLRDGQQSLMSTRMSTADMLPILEKMDQAGYNALECWGGATFDACLRYLHEDPWERLRKIRNQVKKTPLQMLLRGQNLLGYRHYSDDVVDKFVQLSIQNGIDIIRIFDALNDVRNLAAAHQAVKKYHGHSQLTICYTVSPVHTIYYFTELAKKLNEMGADSICIKDMAGILMPDVARELIYQIKKVITVPLHLHTHCTCGIAEMTYQAAIESGIDGIDTAISPFSSGTSQPATESIGLAFKERIDLDFSLLSEIADYFKTIRTKYLANGLISPEMLTPDPKALIYQIPGGMLSNLYAQLQAAGAIAKYDQVLQEVPRVREELGYPPLVTPMSQMVGTQATMNVLSGRRYDQISKEIKNYVSGHYGLSPVPISKEIKSQLIGATPIITSRPADRLVPEYAELKNKYPDFSDEKRLTYILFPQLAPKFYEQESIIKIQAVTRLEGF